jgi:hypothetical protein
VRVRDDTIVSPKGRPTTRQPHPTTAASTRVVSVPSFGHDLPLEGHHPASDLFGLSVEGATRYLKTVEHPDLIIQGERVLPS